MADLPFMRCSDEDGRRLTRMLRKRMVGANGIEIYDTEDGAVVSLSRALAQTIGAPVFKLAYVKEFMTGANVECIKCAPAIADPAHPGETIPSADSATWFIAKTLRYAVDPGATDWPYRRPYLAIGSLVPVVKMAPLNQWYIALGFMGTCPE